MKKLFLSILLIVLIPSLAWSATWYVRPSGGSYGSENGTSYNNAWDGFTNVVWGTGGVVAGDTLYISGTHRETMDVLTAGTSAVNKVTIRGDSPSGAGIIYGSDQITSWTNESGNVWYATLATDPEPVWFDESGTITWGNKVAAKVNLAAKYDYWFDDPNNRLYVYNVGNPSAFTSIEAAVRDYCLYTSWDTRNYVDWRGLTLAYAAKSGIYLYQSAYNIIDGCTLHHIGISQDAYAHEILLDECNNITVSNNTIYESGAHGIEAYKPSSNIIIESNTLYNCHYSCIDVQAFTAGGNLTGLVIRYNKVYYTADFAGPVTDSDGIYVMADSANVVNLAIYENVLYDLCPTAIPDGVRRGIQLYANEGYSLSGTIYNNSLYGFYEYCIYIEAGNGTLAIRNNIAQNTGGATHQILRLVDVTNKTVNNNLWYVTSGNFAGIGGTNYSVWATYQSGTGFDANGINADPKFISKTTGNLALASDSPAINPANNFNAGLTRDYLGVSLPQGAGYDLGAYEYYTTGMITVGTITLGTIGLGGSGEIGIDSGVTCTASGTMVCDTDEDYWTPVTHWIQGVKNSSSLTICEIDVNVHSVTTPGNLAVSVYTGNPPSNGGSQSGSTITVAISATGEAKFIWSSSNPTPTGDYWIKVDPVSGYYALNVGGSACYESACGGSCTQSTYTLSRDAGESWENYDMMFKVYVQ